MKIAHIADTHLIASTSENVEWSMAQVLELMRLEKPDLIVHAGDLSYSTGTIAPWISEALRRWFVDLAKIAPVVVVAGNHDLSRDPTRAGVLRGVLSESAAKGNIFLYDRPEIMTAEEVWDDTKPWPPKSVPIACLPYPNLAQLAAFDPSIPPSELRARASELLEARVRALAVQMPGPGLLIFHGSINGARTSTEQGMTTAEDIVLRESTIPEVFQAILCGHIHRHQQLGRAVYAGSHCPLDHGEEDHPHGVVMWTGAFHDGWQNHPGGDWLYKFIPLTPKHKLLTIDARDRTLASDGDYEALEDFFDHDRLRIRGAKIRVLTYLPRGCDATYQAEQVKRELMGCGAHSVDVRIEREAEDRACDSSSVSASASMPDLIGAFCDRNPDAAPYREELIRFGAEQTVPPELLNQEKLGDWRLLSFEARNWKCLSEVPRIDVPALGQVVAITAKGQVNGQGKSAVMEIEGFCLWGRVPKPLPRLADYVKQGTDEMTMCVEFEARGQVYRVRRGISIKSGEGKGSLFLERQGVGTVNGGTPMQFDDVAWLPISGSNSRETQRMIEALVGTWDSYCNTKNIAQGDAERLCLMPPGPLKETIQAAVIPAAQFEHREACARERASVAEGEGEKLRAQVAVLDQRAATVGECSERVAEFAKQIGRQAEAVEAAKAGVQTAEEALTQARKDLADAEALEQRRSASRARLLAIEDRAAALLNDQTTAQEAINIGTEAQALIDSHATDRAELARLDGIAKEHGALTKAQQNAAQALTAAALALKQAKDDAAQALASEARIRAGWQGRKQTSAAVRQRERSHHEHAIEAERKRSEVVDTPFGEQCVERACPLLAIPIAARANLPTLLEGLKEMTARHDLEVAGEASDALADIAGYQMQADGMAARICPLVDAEAQRRQEYAAASARLVDCIFDAEFYERLRSKVEAFALATEQARVNAATEARTRLAVIAAELERLTAEAYEVESEMGEEPTPDIESLVNAVRTAREGVLASEKELEAHRETESDLREQLGRARAALEAAEADQGRAGEIREQITVRDQEATVARIFARAMGKDGVPFLLLERSLSAIEMHANTFLEPGGLRLEIEPMRDLRSGEQKSEVTIRFYDMWGVHPLAATSGAQGAEIGAALRVSLSKVQRDARGLNSSHVNLDEIFGQHANIRMPECQQIIRRLAKDAGRAFVINHQPELDVVADDRIEVEAGVARLVGARTESVVAA